MFGLQCAVVLSTAAASASAFSLLASGPGPAACTSLTSSFGLSKVSYPLTPDYLEAQTDYWNSRNSQYAPSCVFFPTTASDVAAAVKAVRAAKSRFAVKTAGHNPNKFFSSVDKGVLIDLSKMNQNTYDASTTIGTFQPGQNFGDIYKYFEQFGRTVVGARLAGVGTGLALGGGLSYLSTQYGLACDSFRELEIVLPSGEVTTASPDKNPDLFFALRGGGGNAFGIVTKYTVQTHPAGTFYSGNLIFATEDNGAVLEASADFIANNRDPKAAIITTYERIPNPIGSGSTQLILMFLVYDGPDSGQAFANFTSIPSTINTLGPKTYYQTVNLPVEGTTEVSKADQSFRVAAYRTDDKAGLKNAYDKWKQWCDANKDSYTLASFDVQPVPKSLTDASKYAGGNALQMPDGPWLWVNFLLQTPALALPGQYEKTQASFKALVESVPSSPGLPLFLNDAHVDQKPLRTFTAYSRLQEIKRKYDPDNFFANYTGGWTFD